MKISLIAFVLLLPAVVLADPAPFGLEIGKATVKDVKSKYGAKHSGTNKYTKGEMYDLDVSRISLEGLQSAEVIFSVEEKLLAVICTLPKSKFNSLFDSLKGKYKLVSSSIPFVGDASAKFVDGNTDITLEAPHLGFDMQMSYVHKDLWKAYKEQSNEEEQQKKKKETSQL